MSRNQLIAARLALDTRQFSLADEVNALPESCWTPHFNQRCYQGDWSGAPLLAPSGETHPIRQLCSDPSNRHYVTTPVLAKCPTIQSLLSLFKTKLLSVRLLKLGGHSTIHEHRDHSLSIDDADLRLHVPITTSEDVEFVVAQKRLNMAPGELWYANFNLPHAIYNRGDEPRIHLIIDCEKNAWIEREIMENFEYRVIDEPETQAQTKPVGIVGSTPLPH